MFFLGEFEEFRKRVTVRQLSIFISEFIKEGMEQNLQRARALIRVIDKNFRDHIDGVGRGPRAEHFVPWMCLDLREFEFTIIRIHAVNLFSGWCSKYLNNLNKLVDTRFSWEKRLP